MRRRILLRSAPAAALAVLAGPSLAQFFGQPGKDVVWVPTPESLVEAMLHLAKVHREDYVVDLGSGDGRIPIAAAKGYGARSLGIEYDSDLVEISRRRAAEAGVTGLARFERADIFEADFSAATVVTLFLLPELNLRLRPRLLAMPPGTRVVSNRFGMGEWEPDETVWAENRPAHLWIVPARLEGRWNLRVEAGDAAVQYELRLTQQYQRLEGELKRGIDAKAFRGSVQGASVAFNLNDAGRMRAFVGRLREGTLAGTIRTAGAPDLQWLAVRE